MLINKSKSEIYGWNQTTYSRRSVCNKVYNISKAGLVGLLRGLNWFCREMTDKGSFSTRIREKHTGTEQFKAFEKQKSSELHNHDFLLIWWRNFYRSNTVIVLKYMLSVIIESNRNMRIIDNPSNQETLSKHIMTRCSFDWAATQTKE